MDNVAATSGRGRRPDALCLTSPVSTSRIADPLGLDDLHTFDEAEPVGRIADLLREKIVRPATSSG